MIKRIVEASNVLSYVGYKWDTVNLPIKGNDVSSFVKNNVIFAENGSGKSNLIKILVAMKLNGQIEKNWYMEDQPSKLVVSMRKDKDIEYDGASWKDNSLQKKIIIFDREYIDRYVHSTGKTPQGAGGRDAERGKNIVFLGDFGSHNEEIEKLIKVKDTLKKKTDELKRQNAQDIAPLSPKDMDASDVYAARKLIEASDPTKLDDTKLEQAKLVEERGKLAEAQKKEKEIAALQLLDEVDEKPTLKAKRYKGGVEEEYDLKVDELLGFSVSEAVKKALAAVEHKQHFVKEGTELLSKDPDHCPYCTQSVVGLPLTDSYKKIFTEEFSDSETEVASELRKYKVLLGNLRDVQQPHVNNDRLVEAKKYVTVETDPAVVSATEADRQLIKDEIDLIDTKLAKTLEKVTGSKYADLEKVVARIDKAIDSHNTTVKAINELIKKLKTDASGGKLGDRIAELDQKIAKLDVEIIYMTNKVELIRLIDQYEKISKNDTVVDALERIYQTTKDAIVDQFSKWVEEHYARIAELVKILSPKMSVFNIGGKSTFDRRKIESPAQCGFMIQVNGKDKMDSLSDGERQVVALAYFFAMLEKMKDQDQMIVVLDDPITNFDAGKRKTTAQTIADITAPFRQLFVFTCDPLFKTYLLKQISNRNYYYIFSSAGSSIHYVPSNLETITSSFELDFQNIDTELGTDENIVVYGQKLRFCLETKIKEKYFGYSKDSLNEMIEQVASNSGQMFADLLANKDKILEIYNYCNTGGLAHYPRDGATSWTELKEMIHQYTALNL